jgi:uncharacterized protein (TIGR02265 family)
VPIAYGTLVGYGERTFQDGGPGAGALTFERDMMPPAWHQGSLEAALDRVGVRARVQPAMNTTGAPVPQSR